MTPPTAPPDTLGRHTGGRRFDCVETSMAMRSPKYVEAVAWIGENDSAGDDDPIDVLEGLVTVVMVADLFGVPASTVARDVHDYRHGTPRVALARQWIAFGRRQHAAPTAKGE